MDSSRKFPGAGSSLRSVAGLEDVLDESCGDVEDELVPEFVDIPEARNFPSCRKCSSLVWSGVVFDRWTTHRSIRVLRRAFQVIEMQACHRVFAPSRRDQDRERIPVLPHMFALHHWPLPPLWGSWVSPESFFLSMCQPRFLVPLEILKWALALPWLRGESKTKLYPYF